MFIAVTQPRTLAPAEAKPSNGNYCETAKRTSRSYGAWEQRKNLQAINVSPLWGEVSNTVGCTSNLNPPIVPFTMHKCPRF